MDRNVSLPFLIFTLSNLEKTCHLLFETTDFSGVMKHSNM